jgi:flagella basal body P-ring formation protein FlgA
MRIYNRQQKIKQWLWRMGLLSLSFILYSVFCLSAVSLEGALSDAEALSWSPEQALELYVIDNYPWTAIEVKNIRTKGTFPTAPPEYITMERGPLGSAVFSMIFKNNERVKVRATVKALDRVVKSKRPFKKGHRIRRDDIYLTKMDVTKMPKSAITNAEEIDGKVLKRSVSTNMALTEDMVESGARVRIGKKVTLLLIADGFKITAKGKLKESAHIGLPVKVRNLSSKKVLKGILIDENTVMVEL